MRETAQFKIIELIVQQAGTYKAVKNRPWTASVSADLPGIMAETIDEVGKDGVTEGLMGSQFSSVLRPSSRAGGDVDIPGGWGADRAFWVMRCEVTSTSGAVTVETYSGWTDHLGIGRGKYGTQMNLDEQMVFHIDKIASAKITSARRGSGGSSFRTVVSNMNQVVTSETRGRSLPEVQGSKDSGLRWMLRPSDMPREISLAETCRASNIEEGDANSFDTRSTAYTPKLSSMSNGRGSYFLSKVANAFMDTSYNVDYSGYSESFLPSASNEMEDLELRLCTLPRLLRGGHGYSVDAMFTLSDLQYLDPGVSDRIKITQADLNRITRYDDDRSDWNGQDINTVSVVSAIASILSIMSDMNLGFCRFTTISRYDQYTAKIEYHTIVSGAMGAYQQPDERTLDHLTRRIDRDIISVISEKGEITVDLEMDVSFNNNCFIRISMDDGPMDEFDCPLWASGKAVLTASTDRGDLASLASSVVGLMSEAAQL